MVEDTSMKSITEPARQIKVAREADVVVLGGGPGGISSAIAAARSGAKTVLIERYGHLGGMATGGLVNIIPNLSDINGKQEAVSTLKALQAASGFLRTELARNLSLRRVPELSFHWDDSIEHGDRILRLLDQISAENEGQ